MTEGSPQSQRDKKVFPSQAAFAALPTFPTTIFRSSKKVSQSFLLCAATSAL